MKTKRWINIKLEHKRILIYQESSETTWLPALLFLTAFITVLILATTDDDIPQIISSALYGLLQLILANHNIDLPIKTLKPKGDRNV